LESRCGMRRESARTARSVGPRLRLRPMAADGRRRPCHDGRHRRVAVAVRTALSRQVRVLPCHAARPVPSRAVASRHTWTRSARRAGTDTMAAGDRAWCAAPLRLHAAHGQPTGIGKPPRAAGGSGPLVYWPVACHSNSAPTLLSFLARTFPASYIMPRQPCHTPRQAPSSQRPSSTPPPPPPIPLPPLRTRPAQHASPLSACLRAVACGDRPLFPEADS